MISKSSLFPSALIFRAITTSDGVFLSSTSTFPNFDLYYFRRLLARYYLQRNSFIMPGDYLYHANYTWIPPKEKYHKLPYPARQPGGNKAFQVLGNPSAGGGATPKRTHVYQGKAGRVLGVGTGGGSRPIPQIQPRQKKSSGCCTVM